VPAVAGGPPQQPQRVRQHGARRGGQGAEQAVVVEGVRDHPEDAANVVHLLL
jgi:hypothetical protein